MALLLFAQNCLKGRHDLYCDFPLVDRDYDLESVAINIPASYSPKKIAFLLLQNYLTIGQCKLHIWGCPAVLFHLL